MGVLMTVNGIGVNTIGPGHHDNGQWRPDNHNRPNNNQHFNKPSGPGNDRYDKDKRPDNRRDRDRDRDRKDKDRKEKDKKEKENKRQESKRSEVYRRS